MALTMRPSGTLEEQGWWKMTGRTPVPEDRTVGGVGSQGSGGDLGACVSERIKPRYRILWIFNLPLALASVAGEYIPKTKKGV